MQKSDATWLLLVVAAALLFSVFGLPYFSQLGHPVLSVLVYAFLVVIFIYGRNNRLPRGYRRRKAGESGKAAQEARQAQEVR